MAPLVTPRVLLITAGDTETPVIVIVSRFVYLYKQHCNLSIVRMSCFIGHSSDLGLPLFLLVLVGDGQGAILFHFYWNTNIF